MATVEVMGENLYSVCNFFGTMTVLTCRECTFYKHQWYYRKKPIIRLWISIM